MARDRVHYFAVIFLSALGCGCIVVLMLVSRSRTYHPDRAGSAHERTFILIRLAYETLSDPVKRYAYDR